MQENQTIIFLHKRKAASVLILLLIRAQSAVCAMGSSPYLPEMLDHIARITSLFRLISLPFHQADTLLARGNESSHGVAVSHCVINYPDSFCVARALLSIKVALGRGNFLRGAACYGGGDRDTKPRAILFATARPFAKRN